MNLKAVTPMNTEAEMFPNSRIDFLKSLLSTEQAHLVHMNAFVPLGPPKFSRRFLPSPSTLFSLYNHSLDHYPFQVGTAAAAAEPLASLECGQLLRSLTNSRALEHGRQLHAHMVASGVLLRNTYLATKLCALYAACDCVRHARALFDGIVLRSSFLWNVMIRGYACCGQPLEAVALYRQMLSFGKRADHFAYPFVVMACGDAGLGEIGRRIHAAIVVCGYETDAFVANSLLSMYSKFGRMDYAQKLFDKMPGTDLTSWNTMISGYARNDDPLRSLSLVADMVLRGDQLDEVTLLVVLPACADLKLLKPGREIHAFILRSGMELDGFLCNALIDLYANAKFSMGAQKLFENMRRKDTVSWNTIICSSARLGDAAASLSLFRRMNSEGIVSDAVTLSALLGACDRMAALPHGMSLHAYLILQGLEGKINVGTALVDMYAKCGSLECSRQVFDEMPLRNLVSWSAMISGYGLNGRGMDAVACFNEMKANGITPDEITFTSVLSACSHAGLVHEGKEIFYQMSTVYNLKPKVDHYACVVDILGRAGDLEEAHEFITAMDATMNADVWEALLSACRIHHNVELAEIAAERILVLKPNHIGPYVTLSNMYAIEKRWSDVKRIRDIARQNGLKKPPGCSFVDSKMAIQSHLMGEKLHPQP